MRSLSGFSRVPSLPVVFALMLAAGSRAAAASEPPASPPVGLAARLATVAERAHGKVGVSVMHVESGQEVTLGGDAALPLCSVFKLPLAVVVLKSIERGQLRLEQEAIVEARDVAPSASRNAEKWRNLPVTL